MIATTAPMTRYEVCATILGKDGEVHTRFHTVAVQAPYNTRADIPRELATRYALGGRVRNVSVISVTEIEEDL